MHRIIARLKVELIVLFGYAVGLALVSGFNPQGGFFVVLEDQIMVYTPDIYIRCTIALIVLLVLGLLVKKAFAIGGPAALIAVVMGFLAGLATPTDLQIGLVMLSLGVISAWISITGWKTLKDLRAKRPGI